MSERAKPLVFRLKVGKRGEIYTTKEVREIAGIRAPGEVILVVRGDELVIRRPPSLDELLKRKPVLRITFEEAERASEELQGERGL